jgi:hypothetical protein
MTRTAVADDGDAAVAGDDAVKDNRIHHCDHHHGKRNLQADTGHRETLQTGIQRTSAAADPPIGSDHHVDVHLPRSQGQFRSALHSTQDHRGDGLNGWNPDTAHDEHVQPQRRHAVHGVKVILAYQTGLRIDCAY